MESLAASAWHDIFGKLGAECRFDLGVGRRIAAQLNEGGIQTVSNLA